MGIYLISGRIVGIIWNIPDMSIKKPHWVCALAAICVEFNQMLSVRIFYVSGSEFFVSKPSFKGDVPIVRLQYIFLN